MNVLLVLAVMVLLMMMAGECEGSFLAEEESVRQQQALREGLLEEEKMPHSSATDVGERHVASRSPPVVDSERISTISPISPEHEVEAHRIVSGYIPPPEEYTNALKDVLLAQRIGLEGDDLEYVAARSPGARQGWQIEKDGLAHYLNSPGEKSPQEFWL